MIAAQKANTGNAFSLGHNSVPANGQFPGGLALSTANLYSAVQPGGSLYGLQHSNPVETEVAYGNAPGGEGYPANAGSFGTPQDPMVGQRIGGVDVFGGGFGIYRGASGSAASGSAATRHAPITWSAGERAMLSVWISSRGWPACQENSAHPDNIIFDITPNPYGGTGVSAGGFGHPTCLNNPTAAAVAGLPAVR